MFFFWSSRCWCSYFFHGEIERRNVRSRWEIFRWRWFSIVHVTRSHVNWHAYSFLSCSIHTWIKKNFNTYIQIGASGTHASIFFISYFISNIFFFQIYVKSFVAWKMGWIALFIPKNITCTSFQIIGHLTFFTSNLITRLIKKMYANIVKFKLFFKNLYW